MAPTLPRALLYLGCSAVMAILFAVGPCFSLENAAGPLTPGSLKLDYEIAIEEARRPLKELDELYAGNLAKLEEEASQAGKLQQVLAVKAEMEGFLEGTSPEASEDFPELRRFQSIYRAERAKRLAAVGESTRPIHEGYRRKLDELQTRLTQERKIEEAVAVSEAIARVDELLAAGTLSMPAETASTASVPVAAGGGGSDGITFTEGRLFAVGKMAHDTSIDLGPAEGISDFVNVIGNGDAWAALRKNGDVVGWNRESKAFSVSGIGQLVPTSSLFSPLYGIATTGDVVDLCAGTKVPGIGNVKEAAVGVDHGIALQADGTVQVWGDLYEKSTSGGRKPLPQPPVDALKNVVDVGATAYSTWVVDRAGNLTGWGHGGTVFDKLPREIRGVTRIWCTSFIVYAETRGNKVMRIYADDPTDNRVLDGKPSLIRAGCYSAIQFERNRWQPTSNTKDEHGEWAVLEKLDGSHWPLSCRGPGVADNRSASPSYLLWLSASDAAPSDE